MAHLSWGWSAKSGSLRTVWCIVSTIEYKSAISVKLLFRRICPLADGTNSHFLEEGQTFLPLLSHFLIASASYV